MGAPVPWAYLPPELLELIFMRLDDCLDFLRCQGVCKTWSSLSRQVYRRLFPSLPPLIMYTRPSASTAQPEDQSIVLYSTQSRTESSLNLPIKRCQINGSVSCNGWLLVLSTRIPGEIYLINVASMARIDLPVLEFPINWRLDKIQILTSCDPSDPNCIFFLVDPDTNSTFSHYTPMTDPFDHPCLAVCRKGDTAWTDVQEFLGYGCSVAALYNNEYFCYVDEWATLTLAPIISNFFQSDGKEVEWDDYDNEENLGDTNKFEMSSKYLVESSGDLLLVLQTLKRNSYSNIQFEVYRMEWDDGEWTPVLNLGERALFLSHGHSISIDVPSITNADDEDLACRANCIYFIRFGVSRVYDMETHKCRTLSKFAPAPPGVDLGPFTWIKPVTF